MQTVSRSRMTLQLAKRSKSIYPFEFIIFNYCVSKRELLPARLTSEFLIFGPDTLDHLKMCFHFPWRLECFATFVARKHILCVDYSMVNYDLKRFKPDVNSLRSFDLHAPFLPASMIRLLLLYMSLFLLLNLLLVSWVKELGNNNLNFLIPIIKSILKFNTI
jgi:hypothetical protein